MSNPPRQRAEVSPDQVGADADDDSPTVRITRHYLAELKKACAQRDVQFLVANVPGQGELGEDDISATSDLSDLEEAAYHRAFDRAAQALGLETIDLMRPMVAAKQSKRFA